MSRFNTRLGVVALGAAVTTGLGVSSAFAAAAAPSVTIQPPTENATVNGAPIIVKVGVRNNDALSVSLTGLGLGVACATPTAGVALTGPCAAGDAGVFRVDRVTIDPANTGCSGNPFTISRQDGASNVVVTNANFSIQPGQGCILDVALSALQLPPAGDTIYFVANATVDDGTGPTTTASPDASQLTVVAGPTTPTPPVFPPPPVRPVPPAPPVRHHDAPRCTPDTPNNGNGNIGYGNNGNGNVGNCNNGNGNTGDDNNGNGNGDHDI